MKKITGAALLVVMMAVFGSYAEAAEVYYVQSLRAKVMSAPSFRSTVIAEVAKGQKLEVTRREGNWFRVTVDSKTGYVSALLVARYAPLQRTGLIQGDAAAISKQGVRRRASTYTSAAAARGLAADDRRRLSTEEKVNYEALAAIESMTIGDEELAKFIQETR